MTSFRGFASLAAVRRQLVSFTALCLIAFAGSILAQNAPVSVQDQVQLFQSLPPAQQQELIRQLQRQLPAAQRQAILQVLQGQGQGQGQGQNAGQLDADAARALSDALKNQTPTAEQQRGANPRLLPGDTLVIQFEPPAQSPNTTGAPALSAQEQQEIDEFRERLVKGNPYQLDDLGRLYLPGVPAIPLAGLDVDEATVRVKAETALDPFTVILTFLPLQPVGVAALQPFGYDLFARLPSTFTPATDIPVPTDYVIGPGDTINIQLFGNQNAEYSLPVSRDGAISFPDIGPISVAGLSFNDLRDTINQRVSEQMIGVRASITLGELRSIRVFVLGDVVSPGSYTVTGLSTMTNALFASGGVKTIGSLRKIALRRNGNTVSTLDLYDLLLRGDTRADVRLQPGDAIFVPPIGPTVTVDGEVRRPAIYEIKNERSVADLVALAGGLNANADRTSVKLERVVQNRGTTVQDVDLTASGGQTAVRDGDVLRMPANLPQLDNSVRLAGNVFQPGLYQWSAGMRLRDLLPSPELVKPLSDLNYVLVRREAQPNVSLDVVSGDLEAAWRNPSAPGNVALQPRDTVYVFNLNNGRKEIVEPIIQELEARAAPNTPVPIVRVGGQVKAAGDYPLEAGMRVSDLLRASGGLTDAAYGNEAELTRYAITNGEYRETELVSVNLAALLKGDLTADVTLQPYDYLNVKEVSHWRGQETVTISGEVVFPGEYPIRRGETLSSVLKRAGGLTDLAFPEGSVFTRVELRDREHDQLEVLASRIERDLATISISEPNARDTISTGQSLVDQLRNAVATGRLVIRLDDLVAGRPEADVVLKAGDALFVPDRRPEVTVLGEVQYATSHVFASGASRDDYIGKSGGLTQRADRKRIYVVRANGEVVAGTHARWFQRGSSGAILPGDTIVVPLKVDSPLARWSAVTQIIYNLAIAAAAVHSF